MAALPPDARDGALPGFLDLLPPADRDELHGLGTRRQVPTGAVLFFEGDPAYDALLLRGATVVASPVTQVDLAAWSGLSREAVVKSLRTMRRLGRVENHGRRFVIHDLDAIRSRSGGPDG